MQADVTEVDQARQDHNRVIIDAAAGKIASAVNANRWTRWLVTSPAPSTGLSRKTSILTALIFRQMNYGTAYLETAPWHSA